MLLLIALLLIAAFLLRYQQCFGRRHARRSRRGLVGRD
ncbi:hypothetical protein ACVW16_004179 [Bradyrhizobium sp. USDA 4474]